MKKLLAILLSACMLLTLAACSSTSGTASTASDNSTSSTSSTASDASDSSVDKKPGEGTSKVGIVLGGITGDTAGYFVTLCEGCVVTAVAIAQHLVPVV